MDKIINGYTYTNRLRTDAYSKAKVKSLIEDFYSNAYDLDAISKDQLILSTYSMIKKSNEEKAKKSKQSKGKDSTNNVDQKYGIYVYQGTKLVGLAIYHVSITFNDTIAIDLIDFDPEIRKSFVNKDLDDKEPSEILTNIIKFLSNIAVKNNKSKIILSLSNKVLCLENRFKQLGFEDDANEYKGNIYSKRLVDKNNGWNSNN